MANAENQFKIEGQAGGEEYQGLNDSQPTRRHVQGQVQAARLYRENALSKVLERLLIPRPTDDPKDPLTWSTWRKHSAFCIIFHFLFLSNYSTSSLPPALVLITKDFNITQTQASYLNTFNILFLGIGNLFWVPTSLKIGKDQCSFCVPPSSSLHASGTRRRNPGAPCSEREQCRGLARALSRPLDQPLWPTFTSSVKEVPNLDSTAYSPV